MKTLGTCFTIALLAFGALVGFNLFFGRGVRSRPQGQLTSCKSNLKNLATSLEMYATDNRNQYPPGLGLLTPNYLKVIPLCPPAGKATYEYVGYNPPHRPGPSATPRKGVSPRPLTTPESYTVWCQGGFHKEAGINGDYPQYTSFSGLVLP